VIGAVEFELGGSVPTAEAEIQSAVADQVHDRGLFGQLWRIPQWRKHDRGADSDPTSACGNCCGKSQWLWEVTVPECMVLAEPGRICAPLFGTLTKAQRAFVEIRPVGS
jgi:hypothetical protein